MSKIKPTFTQIKPEEWEILLSYCHMCMNYNITHMDGEIRLPHGYQLAPDIDSWLKICKQANYRSRIRLVADVFKSAHGIDINTRDDIASLKEELFKIINDVVDDNLKILEFI